MGLRVGSKTPGGIVIAGKKIGGMAIGSSVVWPEDQAPAPPRLYVYLDADNALARGVINQVARATSYQWREELNNDWTPWSNTSAQRTFTSLTTINGHKFQARARNAHGDSPPYEVTFLRSNTNPVPLFDPPGVPELVVTPGATVLGITISGGESAESYQWKFSTQVFWTDVALGDANFNYGTDITAETTYTIQARARNRAGVSAAVSATVRTRSTTYVPPPPPAEDDPPAAPSSVSFTATSISITGTIGSVSGATSYEWRRGTSGAYTPIPNGGRTFIDTGLTPETAYTYNVRARNAEGPSPPYTASFSTIARPVVPPTTPAAPAISGQSNTGFDATVATGTADEFRIRWRVSGQTSWTIVAWQASNTFSVTGRTASTGHDVQGQRRNSAGTSDWSATATATTTAPPVQPPAAPPAPTISAISHDRFTATTPAGGAGNMYRFRYKLTTATAWTQTTASSSNSAVITGRAASTSYHVQASRRNSVGWSQWSASATATTTVARPAAPAAPVLSAITSNSMTATVAAATGLSYRVRYRTGAGDWTVLSHVTNRVFNLTGLTDQSAYEVQAGRGNAAGWSDWSASATGTTLAAVPVPPAPTGLTVRLDRTGRSGGVGSGFDGVLVQSARNFSRNPAQGTSPGCLFEATATRSDTGVTTRFRMFVAFVDHIHAFSTGWAYDYHVPRGVSVTATVTARFTWDGVHYGPAATATITRHGVL